MDFLEFASAEKLAEYLGYHYPEEIYVVFDAERCYELNTIGDLVLSPESINDYLRRLGVNVRITSINGGIFYGVTINPEMLGGTDYIC